MDLLFKPKIFSELFHLVVSPAGRLKNA